MCLLDFIIKFLTQKLHTRMTKFIYLDVSDCSAKVSELTQGAYTISGQSTLQVDIRFW